MVLRTCNRWCCRHLNSWWKIGNFHQLFEKKIKKIKKTKRKKNETRKLRYHNGPVYRDTSLTQLWGKDDKDSSSVESSKNGIIEDSTDEDEDSEEDKLTTENKSVVSSKLFVRESPSHDNSVVEGIPLQHKKNCYHLGGLCIETQPTQTVNFFLTATQIVSWNLRPRSWQRIKIWCLRSLRVVQRVLWVCLLLPPKKSERKRRYHPVLWPPRVKSVLWGRSRVRITMKIVILTRKKLLHEHTSLSTVVDS